MCKLWGQILAPGSYMDPSMLFNHLSFISRLCKRTILQLWPGIVVRIKIRLCMEGTQHKMSVVASTKTLKSPFLSPTTHLQLEDFLSARPPQYPSSNYSSPPPPWSQPLSALNYCHHFLMVSVLQTLLPLSPLTLTQ